MAYFGGRFSANMGGGGWSELFAKLPTRRALSTFSQENLALTRLKRAKPGT